MEVNGEQRRVVDADVMVDIANLQKRNAELEAEIKRMRPVVEATERWRSSYEVLKLHRGEVSALLFSTLSEYEAKKP
jgi:hypothetical protein